MLVLLAFSLGLASGLRAFTAPAAASWGALLLIYIVPSTSWLYFMSSRLAAGILTALACFELFTDKLASTPSRLVPVQISARLLTGAVSGATLGAIHDLTFLGGAAGILGSLAGTLGGSMARERLARLFGRDLPAALIEDSACIALAAVCILASQSL